MKKVFYARPATLYGSAQEQADINILEYMGFEVIKTDSLFLKIAYKAIGTQAFFPLVATGDVLAFRAFPDGRIGSGVAELINCAVNNGLPVIELPVLTNIRVLNSADTRAYLQYSGVSH